jgi:hypothetical protein
MKLQVVIVVAGKVPVLLHMMQCKFTHVHSVSNFTGQKKNPSILNILKPIRHCFACNLLDEVENITQKTNLFMGWRIDKLTLHLNKVAHKLCLNLLGHCATQHVIL